MNKRRLTKATLYATALLSPFFFTSCVDNSYDLNKDIDMTVTVGGDLSIPGSGTEEFTLADIMDLDDESVIETDEYGNYILNKSNSTETTVEVEAVHIDPPQSTPSRELIEFSTPVNIGEEVEAPVNNVTTDFTFVKNDVTTDIISLTSAEVDFIATLMLEFDPESYNVEEITLKKGFTITLEIEGQQQPNCIDFELEDTENFGIQDEEAQTIVFLKDQTVRRGEALRVPMHFYTIRNLPEGQGIYESGSFRLQTNLIANGTATTPGLQAGKMSVILITRAEVPDMTLQKVSGIIEPVIEINIDPIMVEGIPDFLQDDVNLDLTNPYIKLEVENGTPASVNLKAQMTWTKDNVVNNGFPIGTDCGENIPGSSIVLAGNATSVYYLSRQRMEDVDLDKNIILGDDLYNLLRNIPDEIKLIDIEAKTLQEEITVDLGNDGADYKVNTTYTLNAPLQFGDELSIVYKDTIDDWSGDLEDMTIKKVVVELKAENGIPLNFKIFADAIDADKNIYPNVKVTPIQNVIAEGHRTAGSDMQPTESSILLEITCENGEMEGLDGLIVRFEADTQDSDYQNITLNEKMVLRLKDIRLRIKDGVKVDLN